jgi:peptidoglycan/LPS O-acetylase OafA/YrhL
MRALPPADAALLEAPPDAPPQSLPRVRQRRFPHVRALDGVRGLAAVAVVIHHCLWASVQGLHFAPHVRVLQTIASFLYLGVDLFFVLSGYLITSLLLLARRSPNYYYNFYWKRVFRILPALLLVLFLTRLIFSVPWSGVLAALLFVANISFVWGVPEIGPFWSLSIEEQFYLVWPTILHRTRPRTILRILIVLLAAPPLLRLISAVLHHGNDRYTPLHCDGLAWGALLALIAFNARVPFRDLNTRALWLKAGRWMFAAGLIAMVAAFLLLHFVHAEYGLLLTATGPLFAGALLYLLTHRRSWVARLLASPPLRFLGDISYMLYLSHAYIMGLYDAHGPSLAAHPTEAGLYLRFLVVLGLSILWSTVSLYAFERPVGSLRRYILKPE